MNTAGGFTSIHAPALPWGRTILSLYDYSGVWSEPYRAHGYHVIQMDIKHGQDVRLFEPPGVPVWGILAAPPCTDLAVSGALHWERKGEEALLNALALVDAVIRIAAVTRPQWWAIENPVGRISRYLGAPRLWFDPCDYGDPYTKKTGLWGDFNANLPKRPVEPTLGNSHIMALGPSPKRQELRSITPRGFAWAFFEANP